MFTEGCCSRLQAWLAPSAVCVSLLFWLACRPVGPLVSWLDIVGLCAIRCSVNVLIKLSVLCNVLGHLPSAEIVLLLLLLLLHFNCFYFTAFKTAAFTQKKSVSGCLHMRWFETCCDNYNCISMKLILLYFFKLLLLSMVSQDSLYFQLNVNLDFCVFNLNVMYFSKGFITVCNYSVSFSSIWRKRNNETNFIFFNFVSSLTR